MKETNDIGRKALELFLRFGIRSVTMDNLASELGISKRTLYGVYREKDELIRAVTELDLKIGQEFLAEIESAGLPALDELFLVNRKIQTLRNRYSPAFYFDLKKYYPEIYERWLREKRENTYQLITRNLRKGKSEGVYRNDIHEHYIGLLHMARIEMLENGEIIGESESASGSFLEEIFKYHLHGICNTTGLANLPSIIEKEKYKSDAL
jgi:AcrR family transcriptional regulator